MPAASHRRAALRRASTALCLTMLTVGAAGACATVSGDRAPSDVVQARATTGARLPYPPSTTPPTADGSPLPTPADQELTVSTPVPPTEGGTDTATKDPAPQAGVGRPAASQRLTFVPRTVTFGSTSDRAAPSAQVEPVNTGLDGDLTLPGDPGRVGWWAGGAMAGDAFGSVVLAGHIDSRVRGVGFFARLLTTEVGDTVSLSDGQVVQAYRVSARRQVPKRVLATGTDLFSHRVPGRLVLITCTGRFDTRTRHYADNLVLVAMPSGPAKVR